MPACQLCIDQIGKPAQSDSHERMVREGTTMLGDGVLEAYTCSECGSKWQRFRTGERESRQGHQYWRRVPITP